MFLYCSLLRSLFSVLCFSFPHGAHLFWRLLFVVLENTAAQSRHTNVFWSVAVLSRTAAVAKLILLRCISDFTLALEYLDVSRCVPEPTIGVACFVNRKPNSVTYP
jgi:hypothetical protein